MKGALWGTRGLVVGTGHVGPEVVRQAEDRWARKGDGTYAHPCIHHLNTACTARPDYTPDRLSPGCQVLDISKHRIEFGLRSPIGQYFAIIVPFASFCCSETRPMACTEERRWRVVLMWKDGRSKAEICRATKYSRRDINKWINCYKSTGRVDTRPKPGRPRLMSDEASERAVALLLGKEHGGCQEVGQQLEREGETSTCRAQNYCDEEGHQAC